MPLVDPLVDDRNLHPLAGVLEPGAPERRRTDLRNASVELGSVADARIDLGDARQSGESAELRAGQHDGHPVRNQLVVPADLRVGKLCRDRVGDAVLRRDKRPRLELPSGFPAGYSERLLRKTDDDLHELAGRRLLARTRGAGRECEQAEQADDETPQQGGHGR